jgi:hypothetical protein
MSSAEASLAAEPVETSRREWAVIMRQRAVADVACCMCSADPGLAATSHSTSRSAAACTRGHIGAGIGLIAAARKHCNHRFKEEHSVGQI